MKQQVATYRAWTNSRRTALPYHLHAKEHKHGQGYPMVVSLYLFLETHTSQPADERHEGLEEAEQKGHLHNRNKMESPESDPICNRNCETIHRQSDG